MKKKEAIQKVKEELEKYGAEVSVMKYCGRCGTEQVGGFCPKCLTNEVEQSSTVAAPPSEPKVKGSQGLEGISESLLDIDVCYDECKLVTVDCVKDFEKNGTIPTSCPQVHIFKKWSENPDRKGEAVK